MGGRNQHFIPRLILRGFLARWTDKDEYAWMTRRNGVIACPNIEGIASKRDFYSPPAADGQRTLDGEITDYEARLTGLVAQLRAASPGDPVPAEVAAEVIAHLTPRAANVRSFFLDGVLSLTRAAGDLFADGEAARSLMGLDAPVVSAEFRSQLREAISGQLLDILSPIPEEVFERIAFTLVREQFDVIFADQQPHIAAGLSMVRDMGPEQVSVSHRKALEGGGMVSLPRQAQLEAFEWSIVAVEGAVLPDCVAVALTHEGEACPYIMADREAARAVIMPIRHDALLVGRAPGEPLVKTSDWNVLAAECSDQFIVSAQKLDALPELATAIGRRGAAYVESLTSDALERLRPPLLPDEPGTNPTTSAFSYAFHMPDWGDDELRDDLNEVVRLVVEGLAPTMPLHRLDGVTYALDYPAALAGLDRGFPTNRPLSTMDADIGRGMAMAPLVLRDGVIKTHVVMRAELGYALVRGDDAEARAQALHMLVAELAEAALNAEIDEQLPGVLLQPWPDVFTADLANEILPAAYAYVTARVSAGFGDDEAMEADLEEGLRNCLEQVGVRFAAAQAAYEDDGDLQAYFRAGLEAAGVVLTFSARLAGHRHGLGRGRLGADGPVAEILQAAELAAWFRNFEADLDRFYRQRGRWAAITEFTDLNVHVERILWQMGFLPWPLDDGAWVQLMPSQWRRAA